jgi:hypothetical protein
MTPPATLAGSRLARLARARPAPPAPTAEPERCDLCAEALDVEHRHLLDLGPEEGRRAVLCACRACAVLFDQRAAGGHRYRRVPERCRRLDEFHLDEAAWDALGVPVALAFFVRDGARGRVVAYCPSAIGTTEAAVDQAAWERLSADNPVLEEIEPDVEALLVHRARGARETWLAPVDQCYRLAAVVRTQWRGLSGGPEVWAAIGRFFEALAGRRDR